MDRKRLARLAYNTAAERAVATLKGEARQQKLRSLMAAHQKRMEQLDFASFLGFHRLDRILDQMAFEHAQGRVGGVQIEVGKAA